MENAQNIVQRCTRCDSEKSTSEFYRGQRFCKSCSKAYAAAWNRANPDRVNANNRACRKNNAEKYRQYDRDRKRVPGYRAAQSALWRARYQQKYREAVKTADFLRRARKKKAPGKNTASERRELFVSYLGKCAYCEHAASTFDHVTALSQGGCNHIGNLVPCCERCNKRKGTKSLLSFLIYEQERRSQCAPA